MAKFENPNRKKLAFCGILLAIATVCTAAISVAATPSSGGLDLRARALVAVPQAAHKVFLSWRFLDQDLPDTVFEVWRSDSAGTKPVRIGEAKQSTTFVDDPGPGTFSYRVIPLSGGLKDLPSRTATVTTSAKGRDWVEILPAAKGRSLQVCDRHFADTDGDGELEFLAFSPQIPSYRGGVAPESYKLQLLELFDGMSPRWEYDTGMGLQTNPFAEGDKRMDWDYEWTFKPVAWDIDGDFKAEIITLVKRNGKYGYVVLKDCGDHAEEIGFLESPIPVGVQDNNNRHFPFFANLGGSHYSFLLQSGTYQQWEMWAYDWNGSGFDLRWHINARSDGFTGTTSSSHTILVLDIDGDGLDEINNGATVLDQDGSVIWAANKFFENNTHIDGQVIADIDPTNPGLEIMMHEEQSWYPKYKMGDRYALYDARSGRMLWGRHAPGAHLQLNVAFNYLSKQGLDIIGTWGGHWPKGSFATAWDGSELASPLTELPIDGDRICAMDWLGDGSKQLALNFTKIIGRNGVLLYEADLSDAPEGEVIPWVADKLNHFWFNVDIVGDYREDIPVQMRDGSVRVYLNTTPLDTREHCKWQSHSYQMMQAPGDYRYYIADLDKCTGKITDPDKAEVERSSEESGKPTDHP
jgi:hypothetical protein